MIDYRHRVVPLARLGLHAEARHHDDKAQGPTAQHVSAVTGRKPRLPASVHSLPGLDYTRRNFNYIPTIWEATKNVWIFFIRKIVALNLLSPNVKYFNLFQKALTLRTT